MLKFITKNSDQYGCIEPAIAVDEIKCIIKTLYMLETKNYSFNSIIITSVNLIVFTSSEIPN